MTQVDLFASVEGVSAPGPIVDTSKTYEPVIDESKTLAPVVVDESQHTGLYVRTCARPGCGKNFSVRHESDPKKFHSLSCANASQSRESKQAAGRKGQEALQERRTSRVARYCEGLSPEEAFSAGVRMTFAVLALRNSGSPTGHMGVLVREASGN